MYFNTYNGRDPDKTKTNNFYGINRLRKPTKGEWADAYNMSTLEYPCAAPRGSRAEVNANYTHTSNVQAVAAPDTRMTTTVAGVTGIARGSGAPSGMCAFWYNNIKKSDYILPLSWEWEIVRINNLYVINGHDPETNDAMMYVYNVWDSTFEAATNGHIVDDLIVAAGYDETNGYYLETYRYAYDDVYNYTVNGTAINKPFFDKYGYPYLQSNPFSKVFDENDEVEILGFPEPPNNGYIWTFNSGTETLTPQNSDDYSANNTVDTDMYPTTTDISSYAITDAVIKGFGERQIGGIGGHTVYVYRVYFDLRNKNGGAAEFEDMIGSGGPENVRYCTGVTVRRRMRRFNHIGVHNNRIWGSTPVGNNIYISSSDDIFDFTPSSIVAGYAGRLALDTGGSVTSMAEYATEMIIFKEDSLTIVYGSGGTIGWTTSNIIGTGCIDGHSTVVTPDGIIFLGYKGFYIFSGGVPGTISDKLNRLYTSAIGGYDGHIYYALAEGQDGTQELLTYDTRYGTWLAQDAHTRGDTGDIKGFFRFRDGFYIVDSDDVWQTDSGDEVVTWSATSPRTYDYTFDAKAVSEIWVRADIEEGAEFTILTAVNDGEFVPHVKFDKPGLNIHRVPIRAKTGDTYTYKITGKGKVVIYEIEIHKTEGGNVYKDRATTEQLDQIKHATYFSY